jgi:hypothetical protein
VASGTDSGPKALPGSFSFSRLTPVGTIRPAGSFVLGGDKVRRGDQVRRPGTRFVVCPGEREYGDIMACTVRDTTC